MAARELPGFGLNGYAPYGEDEWHLWMDTNLRKASAVGIQPRVLSRSTSLPGSPTEGDVYVVPAGDANETKIAVRDDGVWVYYEPQSGWRLWVIDEEAFVYWTGSTWATEVQAGDGERTNFGSVADLASKSFGTPPGSLVVNAPGGPFAFGKVDTEPTHSGKAQSADGTWFELLTPQVTEALFGSTAAMNSFVAYMLANQPITYGRYVNPAGGLEIGRYLTSNAMVDQLDQLAAAVSDLMNGFAYNTLDLEGRTIILRNTLVIDDNTSGNFAKPKVIRNGALQPGPGFPQGAPLIEFRRSGGGTLQLWELEDITFRCNSVASGVLIVPAYSTVCIRFCHMPEPAGDPAGTGAAVYGYGIKTLTPGGNLRAEFNDIRKSSEAGITPSSRTMIGIWIAPASNDGKIVGNRIIYARTAFRGAVSSHIFMANHFWQGPTGTGPFADYTETFLFGSRSNNIVIGNYIDNGKTVLEENLDESGSDLFLGYGQWVGNIFTVAENNSSYSFFVLRPKGAGRKVAHIIFTGNQLRSLGSVNETIQKPFSVDTTYGSIDTTYSFNNKIKDNYFRTKVVPQETEIERFITVGGGVSANPVDFNGFTPFNLEIANVKSYAMRYNTNPGVDTHIRYEMGGDHRSGILRVNPANPGVAVLTAVCNTGSIYDNSVGSF